jgi:DNA-3-methyladenine glycosylase I
MAPMRGVVKGDDGRARCPWAVTTPEYQAYHDGEWGRPTADEDRVYELLCLEGFQAGLSWLTILRKRPAFRQAFASFDPAAVARFGERDIDRLLGDAGIVRHRGKIVAAITNARATLELRQQGRSLAEVVWAHEPRPRRPAATVDGLEPATPASKALSSELRRNGFAFVGPTTVYSAMQGLGVVNDHLTGCAFRHIVDQERARFSRPSSGGRGSARSRAARPRT